ncbi:MAG: PIN domain protein [Acidobacteria bacterium]|nr:PIN domain protein [Acidobacteriota bacterium]
MKQRVYTDTSVIGGCLDVEFQAPSLRLVEKFRSGKAVVVLSELTLLELANAPEKVRDVLKGIPEEYREYLDLTADAKELAELYLSEGVLGSGKQIDAQHIAIATIGRVNVLVSWNFQHIVNLERIRGYNSVNVREGYPVLEIRSPWEVFVDEES